MSELWGLAALSFVSAVTPGPNNVMLWASGVQFGMRRTLGHIVGVTLGVGSMALLVAAGFGVIITTVPAIETTFKVVGSLYLLYLAYRIAGGAAAVKGDVAKPVTLTQAVAFQYVNPKAWVFVLAAVSAFRPEELDVVTGSVLMAAVMMIVIVPCASVWAGAGTFLSRYLADQKRSRLFGICLGALLSATVIYIWI
ncbi:MAG: LysE family translocator [Acidimicrobiia bacterium]